MRWTILLPTCLALYACDTGFINEPEKPSDTGDRSRTVEDTSDPEADDTGIPPDTGEDPPPPIADAHPRLFFSPGDVPRLQAKVFDFERAEIVTTWDRYVSERRDETSLPFAEGAAVPTTADAWAESGSPLPSLAMYTLFTEDEDTFNQTITWLLRLEAQDIWGMEDNLHAGRGAAQLLQATCIAYDMLHDDLDPEVRVQIRGKIVRQAGRLYRSLTGASPVPWANQWSGRDAQAANTALLMAGLVLQHDHEPSAEWLIRSRDFISTTMTQLELLSDGSWPEGPSLASDALNSLYQSLSLTSRHFGDDWTTHPWLVARSEAMLRNTRPGQTHVFAMGDGSDTWIRGPEHQACFVDTTTGGTSATWVAAQHIEVEEGTSRKHELWLEFLWCNPGVPSPPPGPSVPTTHHFAEQGVATWRSGWTNVDSSISLHTGSPVGHSIWEGVADTSIDPSTLDIRSLHPAAGEFTWSPNGFPLLTAGGTQLPKRTALASSYTFSTDIEIDRGWGPVERSDWWSPDSFFDQVGNLYRVGQLGEWADAYGPAPTLLNAEASIEVAEERRGVVVLAGQFGNMYPSEFPTASGWQELGVRRLTRTLIILPSNMILVLDHLEHSTNLTHHARFQSDVSTFSPSGLSASINTADGNTWYVDALSGGSLSTGSHVQRWDEPSGTWVHHLEVSNTASPGKNQHLYGLRNPTQSFSVTRWEPTELGLAVDLTAYTDGISQTYTLRMATSANPSDRSTYLGFPGWIAITPGTETEIRF